MIGDNNVGGLVAIITSDLPLLMTLALQNDGGPDSKKNKICTPFFLPEILHPLGDGYQHFLIG